MKAFFQKRFSNFCRNTSFHGFKELNEAHSKCQKFVWLLIVLGSIGILAFFAKVQCSKLFDGQAISTKITRLKAEEAMRFSPIWLMYWKFSWIDYEKVQALNLTPEELKFSLSYLSSEFEYNDTIVSFEELKRSFEIKLKGAGLSNIKHYFDSISMDIRDAKLGHVLTLEKIYNDTSVMTISKQSINKNDFTESYDFPIWVNMSEFRGNFKKVRTFLHGDGNDTNAEEEPRQDLMNGEMNSFVRLETGQFHNINTDMDIYRSIRDCQNDTSEYIFYSQSVCKLECDFIANESGCRWSNDSVQVTPAYRAGNVRLCSYGIKNTRTGKRDGEGVPIGDPKSSARTGSFDRKSCRDACLPSCDQRKSMWVSSTVAQSDGSPDLAHALIIFPRTLVMIEEVQQYEWHDLISDFGGLLGLWLGASMMSLVQMVHLCCTRGNNSG